MKIYLTGKQAAQADRYSINDFGMLSLVLMERAAMAVVEKIKISGSNQRIFIMSGTGNNGADGLAAGRMLAFQGYTVFAAVIGNIERATEEWKYQYELAVKAGVSCEIYSSEEQLSTAVFSGYDVYADALFGVGLSRNIEGLFRHAVEKWNEAAENRMKIAVDICSGLDAETGQVLGCSTKADVTVTFGYAKVGQILYPGADITGELCVCDIGYPADAHKHVCGSLIYSIDKEDAALMLPIRKEDGNKGTFGKVLTAAGAEGMAGAAYFSAKAAYMVGAGLVVLYTDSANRIILQQKLPEAVYTCFEQADAESVMKGVKAIAAGPGLSKSPGALTVIREIAEKHGDIPLVLDADGLNLTAENDIFCPGENVVFTPHPGELSRLLKNTIGEVRKNLRVSAEKLSDKYRVQAVCKDARTVIHGLDGREWISLTGCSGMAGSVK